MSLTFAVDDVRPASEPPRTCSLAEHLASRPSLAIGGAERRVHAEAKGDGLLSAVHLAFADHRPLVLTPDAIWLTIVRGVAHHVRKNADALRSRLVRHDGQRVLGIEVESFDPGDPHSVEALMSAFAEALSAEVGAGPARLYRCDFSTTTAIERTASEILLLDVYSPFFLYSVGVICGIPEITLEGTPEDWRAIWARIDVIEELDLGFWTVHLKVIVDQLVRAAEGAPDRTFFQRIYKPIENYGEDLVTGWIGWMYPYVGGYGERLNPLLEHPVGALLPDVRDARGRYAGPCIRPSDVPTVLGTCDVTLRERRAGHDRGKRSLHFEGGVGAVEVLASGALRAAAVWVARDGASERYELLARNDRLIALLDRVAAEHTCTPPTEPLRNPTDELDVLYARLATARIGSATVLAVDAVRGRELTVEVSGEIGAPEHRYVGPLTYVVPVLALDCGATLGRCALGWVRLDTGKLGEPRMINYTGLRDGPLRWEYPPYPDDAREIPIVARTLEEVLEWLLSGATTPLPVIETLQAAFDASDPW